MNKHIKNCGEADQKRWLKKRGWLERENNMFRDPDTATPYVFQVAMKRALETCQLSPDFEIEPEMPPIEPGKPPELKISQA